MRNEVTIAVGSGGKLESQFYDMVRREMPGKALQSNVGTRYLFTA
jgi:hypothetical protein